MERNKRAAGETTPAAVKAREDFTISYRHCLLTVKAGQVIDDPEFIAYLLQNQAPVE